MHFLSSNIFFRLYLYLIAGALLFISCNDPDLIGLDVQPPGDKINLVYSDTATVSAFTVREDSLRSDEVSQYLLGSYVDSVFGRTDAGIFAQVLLPSSNVNLGTSLTLDSVVLTLAYSGYYGDISLAQVIHVYQLDESMSLNDSYYSNKIFDYNQTELGSATITPAPNDSVLVDGGNTAPHMRIRLSSQFGDSLLQMSVNSQLTTNENFLTLLKGLYIKADPVISGGGMLYINLLASMSKLTLYYQSDTVAKVFSFVFANESARMTHFSHEYFTPITPVGEQLNDPNHDTSIVYVQSMAGVKTKIRFPNLKNFVAGGMIAVNKAELEITVTDNSDNRLAVPDKLLILGVDANGNPVFLLDQFEGSAYYGGTYSTSERKYKFNIARHIQNVLTGQSEDYGLYLAVSGGVVQANRVIIGGATHPNYRMKLNLYYTKPN